jgi:deoxycytidylate deaminase
MNILHSLKHDFLIIGFTGPLRSGCTTAAKFLENGINQEIKKQIDTYDQLQKEVEMLYVDIFNIKQSDKTDSIKDSEIRLRECLRKREVIKVLKDYMQNDFIYISMTDMLIKSVIEHSYRKIKFPTTYQLTNEKKDLLTRLRDKIHSDYPDIKRLQGLSNLIERRSFSSLNKNDIKKFDDYLNRISKTRNDLSVVCSNTELVGDLLQDFGDNLRRCGDPWDYATEFKKLEPATIFTLAKEANDVIKFYREKGRDHKTAKSNNKQFVVEAFRNPYEVEYFRDRYYEFYLISLFAPYETRREREKFSDKRDKRDQGEQLPVEKYYNQNVSACVKLSDIALNNGKEDTRKKLYDKLLAYFALIKQPGCFAPEWNETAMHMAYSMSVRSTCICRQVGAVIEGPNGYIVGAGWNDVAFGQTGCGYRHYEDFENIAEDVLISNPPGEWGFRNLWLTETGKGRKRDSFCYRDEYRDYLIRRAVFSKVVRARRQILKKLEKSEKRDLAQSISKTISVKMVQYCRALHAEENAILQTSIIGGMGVSGGTIYTSTFPCELCAKKIYQANIKKVVYTEPYPRSISKDVFFQDGPRKIDFEQFEGVKSPSYFRLFKSTIDKKEFQELQSSEEQKGS